MRLETKLSETDSNESAVMLVKRNTCTNRNGHITGHVDILSHELKATRFMVIFQGNKYFISHLCCQQHGDFYRELNKVEQ